jgi:AraC-like DNA-binding protein
MDSLSDVLSMVKPRPRMHASGFEAGGEWAVDFPRPYGVKCYAVVSGQCWMRMEGVTDWVKLVPGDCLLLPRGRPFLMASDPKVTPIEASAVFSGIRDGGLAVINGGGDFSLVGSIFELEGSHSDVLLSVLPPIIHIRDEADKAVLCWSMERMREELRERRPGSFLVLQHLAQMMLVQALRIFLSDGPKGEAGWLFALADRQMGAAIDAIHEDPAHRWTLADLAVKAGMSRSTFALRFKQMVGLAPMEYVTRWRMLLAADRLTGTEQAVSTIAASLGYESDSAFSTAFKKVMGVSPRQYAREKGARQDGQEGGPRAGRDAGRGRRQHALQEGGDVGGPQVIQHGIQQGEPPGGHVGGEVGGEAERRVGRQEARMQGGDFADAAE